jgi:hypothetical protein
MIERERERERERQSRRGQVLRRDGSTNLACVLANPAMRYLRRRGWKLAANRLLGCKLPGGILRISPLFRTEWLGDDDELASNVPRILAVSGNFKTSCALPQ